MSKSYVKMAPSALTIDARYQRDRDEGKVQAIGKSFDPTLIGVVVVSKREDETNVVIDGQHRVGGMVLVGYDKPIMCEVHTGLSLQEEAKLFLKLNNGRTAVRTFDKWRASMVSKDPVSLDINRVVKDAGLHVTKAQSAKNGICAIQALFSSYHRDNLAETLGVLVEWAEDGDPSFFEGTLIKAVSIFLAKYPQAKPSILAHKLKSQKRAPGRLVNKLREMKRVDIRPTIAAQSVFRDIYNERMTKDARLPPPEADAA